MNIKIEKITVIAPVKTRSGHIRYSKIAVGFNYFVAGRGVTLHGAPAHPQKTQQYSVWQWLCWVMDGCTRGV